MPIRHGGLCLLRILDPEARYVACLPEFCQITIVTNKFFQLFLLQGPVTRSVAQRAPDQRPVYGAYFSLPDVL